MYARHRQQLAQELDDNRKLALAMARVRRARQRLEQQARAEEAARAKQQERQQREKQVVREVCYFSPDAHHP